MHQILVEIRAKNLHAFGEFNTITVTLWGETPVTVDDPTWSGIEYTAEQWDIDTDFVHYIGTLNLIQGMTVGASSLIMYNDTHYLITKKSDKSFSYTIEKEEE